MKDELLLLFRDLADLSPAERSRYFEQNEVNADLRAEVESLLEFDAKTGPSFVNSLATEAEHLLRSTDSPPLGKRCGPYRLVQLLGRGGAGAVFLAERADGEVEHRVAVKLLRHEMERPIFRDRFMQERQILASLQHPGIARLIDAGQTEDGQPYLVMDYIDGVLIDVYAANLELRNKLRLVLKVCDAVSYAHRNLVVHRDIKPSNILVDAAGEPKLLDFGIAKILDAATDQTRTQERLLTPDYASPEQVRGAAQTTATDVYSLGAVLYTLLTGKSPHKFPNTTPEAIHAAICTAEPAAARSVNPELPKDLDFILRKALRKEPEERYASVEALANDIQAFLESRPVEARSGNAWYRTRKFLRRYWVPAVAAALVVASLSAGLYIANRQRALAQQRFRDVRELSNKLFDIDAAVMEIPGTTKARQLIVDTSLEYLRKLRTDVQGDPQLALEVANAYMSVAEVEGVSGGNDLGQTDNAERDLRVASDLIEFVLRKQPANRPALLRAAEINVDQMTLAWRGNRYDGALPFARRAAEYLEKFNPQKSDKPRREEILRMYSNVAWEYMMSEHLDEALQLTNRAEELSKLLGVPAAYFFDTKALALRFKGDLQAALTTIRESIQFLESVPPGLFQQSALAMALSREGWILGGGDYDLHLGRTQEAVAVLDRAFKIADEPVHKDANNEGSRSRLFLPGGPLGNILWPSDPRRALEVYDHTYRDMTQIQSRLLEIREVDLLAGSSYALRHLGRAAEARERLDRAFALLAELKLYPAEKIEASSEADFALCALADHEADTGNVGGAIGIYEDLLMRLQAGGVKPETSLQDATDLSKIWTSMAQLYRQAQNRDLASAMAKRRLDLWRHWDSNLPNNPFVRGKVAAAVDFAR
jgi:serine/threonine protein kinase